MMNKIREKPETVVLQPSTTVQSFSTLYRDNTNGKERPESFLLVNPRIEPSTLSLSYRVPQDMRIKSGADRLFLCQDVAKYFLSLIDEDAGDLISNLKLQKLVYYAQGFHLAIFGKALFKEKIEAWVHGPVIPALYHEYKRYGNQGIPIPRYVDFSVYSEDVKELLNEVYSVYGQFSAWKLRNMTHSERPWKEAIASNNPIISNSSLRTYFLTQIEDDLENGKE